MKLKKTELAVLHESYVKKIKERDDTISELRVLVQEIYDWTTYKQTTWAIRAKVVLDQTPDDRLDACPECGRDNVQTSWEDDIAPYGVEGKTKVASIPVKVPVRGCLICGFHWTDCVAEEIRDKTVREYWEEHGGHDL